MKYSSVLLLSLIAASCCGGGERPRLPNPPSGAAAEGGPIIEESWEHMPQWKGDYIAIGGARPSRLYYRYLVDSDSGVELERVSDGAVVWRVHVEPMNIVAGWSGYRNNVDVRIDGARVVVEVRGAGGRLVEVRDLVTGRQISREITHS